MMRPCDACGVDYEAKTSRSKFCSAKCKQRSHRGGGEKNGAKRQNEAPQLASVAAATLLELQEAKRLHTPLGQAALALAHRLDLSHTDTGAGVASLAKQLQATLAAATADVAAEQADPVDEVRAARERKLRAAQTG